MKSRIVGTITILSLALFVCTGLMFVLHRAEGSHRTECGWYFDFRDRRLGGFQVEWAWPDGERVVDNKFRPIEPLATAAKNPPPPTRSGGLGFVLERGRYPIDTEVLREHGVSPSEMNLMARPHEYRRLFFPRWCMGAISLLEAIMPARWAVRFRRRRVLEHRRKTGLCLVCGYDLRASKERCPECGTVKEGVVVVS